MILFILIAINIISALVYYCYRTYTSWYELEFDNTDRMTEVFIMLIVGFLYGPSYILYKVFMFFDDKNFIKRKALEKRLKDDKRKKDVNNVEFINYKLKQWHK